MKEQIDRYARGLFEYDPLVAIADEKNIFVVVDKNREFRGYIHIKEQMDRELKGVVYSSNDQVVIDEEGFAGSNVKVTYFVNSRDCDSGDIIEGVFTIVCNGGEIKIPYSFRIEAGSHETMTGQVRNQYQFAELAQNNIDEAVTLFQTDDFKEVFLGDDLSLRCIYDNLERGTDTRNSIEEFLIAIRKKRRADISIPDNSITYDDVEENFKDSLIIEKDMWGYVDIRVNCDAPFIKLERRVIDSEVFTGNRYEFSYVIDADRLHAGRNYGKITFETINRTVSFYITARKSGSPKKDIASTHKLIHSLITLYIRFRTKAIHVNEWIRESGIVIEALSAIDEDNLFYRLALAQLYIAEKKDDKAKELIESVKDEIETDNVANYPLYCYFIYINTLYNKDWSYSKRATVMIKECYEKNEDWRILWTLLFIDEELEGNPSLKLLRIKEQFNEGVISPVMYLEACRTFNQNPALLRVLNSFEINVLLFGAKNNFLNEKLADQAVSLIDTMRNQTPKVVRLMFLIWENNKDNSVLEGLCRILIRNNYVGEKYLPVYEAAIEAKIKLTQIFEYYMMSRNPKDMSPMPKMVLMYFGYNNNLDYIKKAYLFANIVINKTENAQTYKTYLPQMEVFVREQCALGRINDNLIILYRNLLTPDVVTTENARAVSELFFTYKLSIDNPNYVKVVVRHKESRSEREYPLEKNSAYVKIYTEDASISFVSARGNRFNGGEGLKLNRIFEDDSIVKRCMELDDTLDFCKIYYVEKMLKYQKQTMDSVDKIKDILKLDIINTSFRKKLVDAVVDYYYDSYDGENFEAFFGGLSSSDISPEALVKCIEIRIIQGEYLKAYKMLKKHSAMSLVPKRLMKLCMKTILTTNEADKRLLQMAYLAFSKDAYDEIILQYLIEYYNGSTEAMCEIWKASMNFELDTYDIEERLLAQMMYCGQYSDEMMDVFLHYYSAGPRDRIVDAFLSYHAYRYFVKQQDIPEDIFELMEVSYENEKELNLVCKMALVKYYSGKNTLSEFRKEIASKILYELARKEMVFPFFLDMKDELKLPYDIADRTMVEYRANPKSRVVIHYVLENKEKKKKYVSEDMKQVYEGIFVRQFILFYGETLQYYISEENANEKTVTDAVTLTNTNTCPDKSDGRYELLNDIIACSSMHEYETFRKLLHTYAVNDYVTGRVFEIL